MSKKEIVIVINPGSTSTKIALYSRKGEIVSETIRHPQHELEPFARNSDQINYRYNKIWQVIDNWLVDRIDLLVVGIVARGGIVKQLGGGTYKINDAFLNDARNGTYGDHASNLGSLLANKLMPDFRLEECYTVDPVSSGNMWPKAEISGVPGIKRVGRGHPLNMKMTARKIALKQKIEFEDSKYVIAHLGGGISISLVIGGKFVDVNDALLGMGPFSPNRAGALPLRGLMDLCYSKTRKEVEVLLSKNSGLKAYLGTEDVAQIIEQIEQGDKNAALIFDAFVYQIAKEIGAYYAASRCMAQAIIVTGGVSYSNYFIAKLKEYVGSLTEFFVYPGENEMEALSEGIFRVLDKDEKALDY